MLIKDLINKMLRITNLRELLLDRLPGLITANGVHPYPCYWIEAETGSFIDTDIDACIHQGYAYLQTIVPYGRARELVVGFDRRTVSKARNRMPNVVTILHYFRGKWECGIVEYNEKTGDVLPYSTTNEFWQALMREELEMNDLIRNLN